MKVKLWKPKRIKPAKYNPRTWGEKEKAGLKESIKKFGCVDPLIVNVRDKKNILVGGHLRLVVLEELEYETVPVVEVDLSPAEEKALKVALNSPTISGKFNDDILQEVLNEIRVEVPELCQALNFDDLSIDFGEDSDIEKDDEDDSDGEEVSEHSISVKHTCPSCGYEW